MAFANPQTITIGGTAHSLKRVNQDNSSATFRKVAAGLEITMNVRHSYEKARPDGSQIVRSNVEVVHTTYDAANVATSTIAYSVIRWKRGTDPVVASNVLAAVSGLVNTQATSVVDWDIGP